jgi:FixJ family two-component response regulator
MAGGAIGAQNTQIEAGGGGAAVAGQTARKRILVVEDDHPLRASLIFDLEAGGCEVAAFAEAGDALDGVFDTDCLVIDFSLPDSDGMKLIQALRDKGVAAPAILMTTDPSRALRTAAARASVTILEKPLIGEALRDLIDRLTGRGL